MGRTGDEHDLQRFLDAQRDAFTAARSELAAGRKRSHWMWFVFPQVEGLGRSPTARRYAIRSFAEARAYLAHPILGARLLECAALLLEARAGASARDVLGTPDDIKLRSSMTLFAAVAGEPRPFERVLDRHFGGTPDPLTVAVLQRWLAAEG
jgi:uncharacterized protein (DUF1810 family)